MYRMQNSYPIIPYPLLLIIFHIISFLIIFGMFNSNSKLPYKVKFELDYQQYNQKLSKLPVAPPDPSFKVSDEIIQLIDNVKEKIKYQQLQFLPSTIYSQYATPAALKDGKKNVSENCPGCGDQLKKQVQCQFCAVTYCKNCCWRKRVIPGLSEPKDSKLECQDCHGKFVKLMANQNFYQEVATYNKIIDSSNTRIKKLEKEVKVKKDKVDNVQKKKKQLKIKQGIVMKDIKTEEKKIVELRQKLQQIVNRKADQIRRQEQQKQQQKRRLMEEEQRKRRETEEQLRKLQEKEEEQRKMQDMQEKRKQEERRKIQDKERLEKQRRDIEERQREYQKIKQLEKEQNMKKQRQAEEFRAKETETPRQISKKEEEPKLKENQPIKSSFQKIVEPQVRKALKKSGVSRSSNQEVFETSPINNLLTSSPENNSVKKSFDSDTPSPLKVLSSFNGLQQNSKKSEKSSFTNETLTKTQDFQVTQIKLSTPIDEGNGNSQKIQLIGQQKVKEQVKSVKVQEPLANVSEMTMKQILDITVNPYTNTYVKMSERQSLKQQRRFSEIKNHIPEQKQTINEITEEEKYEILRSSSMSSSLLNSYRNEDQDQHNNQPEISGQKCNCSLM